MRPALFMSVLVIAASSGCAGCGPGDAPDAGDVVDAGHNIDAGATSDAGFADGGVWSVQSIKDGTVPPQSYVLVDGVWVTAVGSGAVTTIVVQMPAGVTDNGHPYPSYAGVRVVVTAGQATTIPAAGDCVRGVGRAVDFNGITQIDRPDGGPDVSVLDAAGCGAPPSPHVVSLGDVATTEGAERYEGVLVAVHDVTVVGTLSGNRFTITDGSSTLVADDLFYDAAPAVDTAYSSLAGVLLFNSFDGEYRLMPRSAADVQ